MNHVKYAYDCREIFEYYGIDNQREQLIQECAELIQALTKNDEKNVLEEMADVQVMLDQFKLGVEDCAEQIEEIQQQKVQRQIERIESEEK